MYNFYKNLFLILFLISSQKVNSDELLTSEYATISPLAESSLLLASEQYGSLSVVAGERGHILYSNNDKNWTQAIVETRATLTNIFIIDEKTAWAVGHDAVILKTDDGARTWRKVFSDVDEEVPLLDLYFKDKLNGIAVGAYSLIYLTKDGGLSWQKSELNLSNNDNESLSEYTDVFDFHLNDIAFAGEKRFYIAAEAGHILRSDDEGKSWLNLTTSYQGSFFGVLPLSFNEAIAYGLRGHLYRSADAGNSWKQIETDSREMLTNAKLLSSGDVVVVGLSGTLLLSKDNANSFSKINLNHRHSLSSVLEAKDGSIFLVGDSGIELFPRDKLIIDK